MPTKFEGLLDQDHSVELEKNSLNGKFHLNLPTKFPTWRPRIGSPFSFSSLRPEFPSLLTRHGVQKKPLRRTAWLDGLRGFAAFLVYIHHNQLWAHGFDGNRIFEAGFGYEGKHYFAAFPFIRLFFAGGHFAVAIFFVISGYVLAVKALGLIHKGQHLAAADAIGSALFRRWLRLFIPVMGVTLLWLTQRHIFNIWVDHGEPLKSSYFEELLWWYRSFKNYSFVFLEGGSFDFSMKYHMHAWTIPHEFRGSIIIFTVVPAFARCTRNARLWCTAILMWYFMYVVDGWYGAAFCSGMLLCDLDILSMNDDLPRWMKKLAPFKELIFFHLLVIGLYLGGCPSVELGSDRVDYETLLYRTPGWRFLSYLKPQAVYDTKWFFLFWGAFITVSAIPQLPWLKAFFETRFCQYLAKISFALYLVHGPMMVLLADRLYAATGLGRLSHQEHIPGWIDKFPLSKSQPFGLELAFWVPQLINLPATLYCAEIITKMFDEPSVKISNWLYRKTLAPPVSPTRQP